MLWSHPLTFVNARVLTPEGRLARTIRIAGDVIDGLDVAPDKGDAIIDLEDSFVLPGLINAHDHLELNSQPRLKWRDRYDNASEWIADFQPRFKDDPDLAVTRPSTLDDRVWVGGLKNLLSGVTTVCHHNPMHRPLRDRFPVRIVRRFGYSHSLQIDGERVAASYRATPKDWPWIIHAGEGVDTAARSELDSLERLGCVGANTVIVHGIAFCSQSAERVIGAGAGLIWCPSSSRFLFNAVADVRAFDDAERLALGSDSRLSGESDLLAELAVAHETRQLSAEGLARTVTTGAAQLLRLPSAGRLAAGLPADLAVFRASAPCPFDNMVRASRTDIRMTMIAGKPCIAEPELQPVFDATNVGSQYASVDESPRLVARWIGRHVMRMRLAEPGFQVH